MALTSHTEAGAQTACVRDSSFYVNKNSEVQVSFNAVLFMHELADGLFQKEYTTRTNEGVKDDFSKADKKEGSRISAVFVKGGNKYRSIPFPS